MSTSKSFRNQFDLRRVPFVALITYVIALFAWVAIVGRWLPMPGMVSGLHMSDPGAPEAMALSNGIIGFGLYLLMWGVMMIAMMYPSSVPLFRLYSKTLKGTTKGGKIARVGAFLVTYAVMWTLTGIVPLVINAVIPIAAIASEHSGFLIGGSLLLLSVYQLTPYKHQCLRHCRSPFGFLMGHYQPGIRGAIQMSWRYSIFCVGCCWALFAFMVIVGSMNIVWMAIIAVVLSLERTVSWGGRLASAVGVLAGAAGSALIVVTIL